MRVLATKKSKLIPRIGRPVVLEDQKIAIFQVSDGRIFAIEDYCPLTNAPVLEGIVSGEYLYEPMREYKISLVDGVIQEPDEGQLKVYPVEVIDDDIFVEV
ncbi:assimilatory nitrite reductase [NAD(P)H] small subunit [Enterococcus florum]|uniref:Assimilatory nitrite reductase [NAD(P)H] small subunit n=1 Tax=Enterococcus florum TaxID=2480627 RepID=A0A4V0WPX6_9ENTE|nr:nitrite reductase (NAD(P)H) small subunit [Enterococcus florum]GCF95389.1 assimilatory nitrite reductase [NAD(P)H] small subunit [Enterococcus florum]